MEYYAVFAVNTEFFGTQPLAVFREKYEAERWAATHEWMQLSIEHYMLNIASFKIDKAIDYRQK